jgi:WD40 repeat protein
MSGDGGSALFVRPVLAIDPEFHTAMIKSADVDAAGRIAVTGSEDRTVRIWSLEDGTLERTIRLPQGLGNIGKAYAVSVSPDGELIAVGGWTRWSDDDKQQQIYIFSAINGTMRQRIDGLPNVVNNLMFSRDGQRLAVAIGWNAGLRLYERNGAGHWIETTTSGRYGDDILNVAFDNDGWLATTSRDGRILLHDPDGGLVKTAISWPAQPHGLAFNPTDHRLAVGFADRPAVMIFDGRTLRPLRAPDVGGIDNSLATVAWSADGTTLFAGGWYQEGNSRPVISWDFGGFGRRRLLPVGDNTVRSLRPLPDGALLVASADPWLGVLEADGGPRWTQRPRQFDPRHQETTMKGSPDGMVIEFGLRYGGLDRRRFDVGTLQLSPACEDGRVHPPRQDDLAIARWKDQVSPTLNGAPLHLEPSEIARCLAIHPDGDRFLLGTDTNLR